MSRSPGRRNRPPAIVWLALGFVAILGGVCAVLGVLAWQGFEQAAALRAEVEALRGDRQATEERLNALQGSASAMEERLRTLEANDPAQQLEALRAAVASATDTQQLDQQRASLAELQGRLNGFQATLDELSDRLDALAAGSAGAAATVPAGEVRLSVARQQQAHSLSCEASAASMAAQYHGVALGEEEVLAALPRDDNPHLGFRGNVDGPTGDIVDYGVYAGPVASVLEGAGLRATLVENGLEGIRAAIARGNPVIAWLTYNCMASTPQTATIGGQAVTLVPNQHVVVVTGFTPGGLWANDPYDGGEDFFEDADLVRCMGYFGDMALEVAAP